MRAARALPSSARRRSRLRRAPTAANSAATYKPVRRIRKKMTSAATSIGPGHRIPTASARRFQAAQLDSSVSLRRGPQRRRGDAGATTPWLPASAGRQWLSPVPCHSLLRAARGSVDAARRAGISVAAKATTVRTTATISREVASAGETSKRRVRSSRVRSSAPARPDAQCPGDDHRAFTQDQPVDIRPAGADGHADADLLAPPLDVVADQPVNADRGEDQGQQRRNRRGEPS